MWASLSCLWFRLSRLIKANNGKFLTLVTLLSNKPINNLTARLHSNAMYYVAVLFFGFLLGIFFPPSWLGHLPLCIIKLSLGFDCPGCGMSRAWVHLFHGHLRQAASFNVAVYPLSFIFLLSFLNYCRFILSGNFSVWPARLITKVLSPVFVLLLLGQWLVKLAMA